MVLFFGAWRYIRDRLAGLPDIATRRTEEFPFSVLSAAGENKQFTFIFVPADIMLLRSVPRSRIFNSRLGNILFSLIILYDVVGCVLRFFTTAASVYII